jgi:hypothetical protein
MSAPPRLLEEGSTFESTLLRAGSKERPSRAGMDRALAAASTVALATCASTVPKTGLAALARLPAWLIAAGGGIVALGVAAAIVTSSTTRSEAARRPVASPVAPTSSAAAPPASATSIRVITPAELPSAPPLPPPRRAVVPDAVPTTATSEAAPAPAVAPAEPDELTLLRRAKTEIARRDGRAALAALDRHARAYPTTAFGEEAAALRVEALSSAGDDAAARAAAATFLARHPESPYGQRVRSAIERLGR